MRRMTSIFGGVPKPPAGEELGLRRNAALCDLLLPVTLRTGDIYVSLQFLFYI